MCRSTGLARPSVLITRRLEGAENQNDVNVSQGSSDREACMPMSIQKVNSQT